LSLKFALLAGAQQAPIQSRFDKNVAEHTWAGKQIFAFKKERISSSAGRRTGPSDLPADTESAPQGARFSENYCDRYD
jgi:hypothetical protein